MVLDLTVINKCFIQVCSLYFTSNVFIHNDQFAHDYIVETVLHGLSAFSTTTSIILVWEQLKPVSNVTYEYEVAYSVDPECSGDYVSLPDGYSTLYYPRTSINYIEVVGLMSGTCYVFGVRAYTSVTYSPGEFSLIQGNTISEGCCCMQNNVFTFLYLHFRSTFIYYTIQYRAHSWVCHNEYSHCSTCWIVNSSDSGIVIQYY